MHGAWTDEFGYTCIKICVVLRQIERTLSQQTFLIAQEHCMHTVQMYRRVQELKCNVVSHACKHKPDSCILPYWSDRVCRKLAENTNTAWGDCLKLETRFLSTVFSCAGNHLAVHAYQVFLPETWVSSLPFRPHLLWLSKRQNFRLIRLNLSLYNRLWSLFFRHFCFGWEGYLLMPQHRYRSKFILRLKLHG